MRTRFAPSPTGLLHIGHARAALEAFNYAEKQNGQCILRIEDTDHTRCKFENTQAIFADLDWLGFDWPLPVRIQSQHYAEYAKVVLNLIERGLAYPCELTRSDIKSGQTPKPANFDKAHILNIISETSYHVAPSLPFAIRLDLSKALDSLDNDDLLFEELGSLYKGLHDVREKLGGKVDPIIARKDIGCSYMIAGPHDDAKQGITHVVRGADLFEETPMQVLIQSLMDWPRPLYYHHDLVRNDTGDKLAKRNLDTTLQSLRQAGQTPDDIWTMAL